MHSYSSEEEDEFEVVVIDSDSDSKTTSKAKKSKKKKPIVCRDISSFMAGSKHPGTEVNGIVDASNIRKKKKNILPFHKTRLKLRTMKHVNPLPHRPNNNASFLPDASGRRVNLHWFTERP